MSDPPKNSSVQLEAFEVLFTLFNALRTAAIEEAERREREVAAVISVLEEKKLLTRHEVKQRAQEIQDALAVDDVLRGSLRSESTHATEDLFAALLRKLRRPESDTP